MEAVIIPAKTVVQINGVPVKLAVDTIVETSHGNMSQLAGYHYVHLPEPPADAEIPVSAHVGFAHGG